jgi:hypothetical protein
MIGWLGNSAARMEVAVSTPLWAATISSVSVLLGDAGRSVGLDPRRVPYNMGTRRDQSERRIRGDRRCVAAAAERTTVVVTQPGRTGPCGLTVPAADRRVIE